MGNEKKHVSKSQMEMFFRCAESYRRRYIEGEKIPPAIAMLKGSGVHKGAETNSRQKIETHEDLKKPLIIDAAVEGFKASLEKDGTQLSKAEASEGKDIVIGKATDSVASLAGLYADELAPTIQPVMVEERITLQMQGSDYDLLGILDLVDERGIVRDLKTAGKTPAANAAHQSLQLTIYWLLHRALTGKEPAAVALDYLIETKKPKLLTLESQRDKSDVDVLAASFLAFERGIKSGSFPPNTFGWWCSEKFCGYYATCAFCSKRGAAAESE